MPETFLKLIRRRDPAVEPPLWLGFFRLREGPPSAHTPGTGEYERTLVIHWPRALWIGLATLVVLYAFAAATIYVRLQESTGNRLTWQDAVFFPWQRDEIREKRGLALIDLGLRDFEAGNLVDAFQKLRLGLSYAPQSYLGRQELAVVYVWLDKQEIATATLREGQSLGWRDTTFLSNLLNFCAWQENYTWWQEICDYALARAEAPGETKNAKLIDWLIEHKVRGYLLAQQPAQALAFTTPRIAAAPRTSLVLLHGSLLLQDKQPEAAIRQLTAWRQQSGDRKELLLLLARAYREAGQTAEMEETYARLKQLDPLDHLIYASVVASRSLLGDDAGARSELESSILRFGSSVDALFNIASALSQKPDFPLMRLCLQLAEEQGLPLYKLQNLLVETYLAADELKEARHLLTQMNALDPQPADVDLFWLTSRHRLVEAALETSQLQQDSLVECLRGKPLSLEFYRKFLRILEKAGRPATALAVNSLAIIRFPAQRFLKDNDPRLREAVARAEAARPPPLFPNLISAVAENDPLTATSRDKINELSNEDTFIGTLRANLAADRKDAVLSSILAARRLNPAWLPARLPEMISAELRIYGQTNNFFYLRTTARNYLNGNQDRLELILAASRNLGYLNLDEAALILREEVRRKHPDVLAAEGTTGILTAPLAPADSETP